MTSRQTAATLFKKDAAMLLLLRLGNRNRKSEASNEGSSSCKPIEQMPPTRQQLRKKARQARRAGAVA